MSRIIKVRCNAEKRHVNEVDLRKALRSYLVLKGRQGSGQQSIPERLVLPCRFCTEGKVIITRAAIEANL